MSTVAIYKTELLHASETFIREQALSYGRWSPILFGMRRVPGLNLDDLDVRLLQERPGSAATSRFADFSTRLQRRLWIAPRGSGHTLRAAHPDVLHIHFGTEAVDIWPVARTLGIPVVVTLHGYDIAIRRSYWESGAAGGIRRHYPRRLLELAGNPDVHFIAVSDALRRDALAFGLPADRVTTSYIGIDCQKFLPRGEPIDRRPRRILFVGRLVEKKGVRFLLEAFAHVRASLPDAELVIVGDGPLQPSLQSLAISLNLPVRFAGQCSAEEVRRELDRARVFCLPSIVAQNGDAEGFGLVLLEAQACGVPVVTSAHGGAQEGLAENVTGISVGEGGVHALAQSLLFVLRDDLRARAMSQAAPEFVRSKFDLRACTHALERLYDDWTEIRRAAGRLVALGS